MKFEVVAQNISILHCIFTMHNRIWTTGFLSLGTTKKHEVIPSDKTFLYSKFYKIIISTMLHEAKEEQEFISITFFCSIFPFTSEDNWAKRETYKVIVFIEQ